MSFLTPRNTYLFLIWSLGLLSYSLFVPSGAYIFTLVICYTVLSFMCRIEGLVSNPYNERGYREMEYFYINKRPISKVQKFKNAISAIFSHFSSKSKPSFILNLTMNYDHIDVNISPDKRSAYIYSEDYIIRTFKVSFYAILLIVILFLLVTLVNVKIVLR